jgi:hypothetical protein
MTPQALSGRRKKRPGQAEKSSSLSFGMFINLLSCIVIDEDVLWRAAQLSAAITVAWM